MIDSMMIIRADASPEIGIGHVMRCLALARSLHTYKIKPIFICKKLPNKLKQKLSNENIKYILLDTKLDTDNDIQKVVNYSYEYKVNWIIVDGYQFDSKYQKKIKEAGLKVLFFDDYGHCDRYYADLILNQNFGANENLYHNKQIHSKLLLGNKYTLLRNEFLKWQKWKRKISKVANKIIVTMGGSDPNNVTLKVIKSLVLLNNYCSDLEVIVIVGDSNFHFRTLKSHCDNLDLNITLLQNVDNMAELMVWADIAIAAGGSTNWELAFMGLPSIVITIADNQTKIAKTLDDMSVVINLGWYENVNEEIIKEAIVFLRSDRKKRNNMSKLGRKLIDGRGCDRVISSILSQLN